jgi:signal transduction histidine kinase
VGVASTSADALQRAEELVGLADRVEALGGTIEVHSPAGEGTRLQIDLPIEDHPPR